MKYVNNTVWINFSMGALNTGEYTYLKLEYNAIVAQELGLLLIQCGDIFQMNIRN